MRDGPRWLSKCGERALKSRNQEATEPRLIAPDVERLASKIAKLALVDTLAIFSNSLRVLASPGKRRLHTSAKRVLAIIDKEWARRSKQQIPSDGFFKWPSTEAPGGDGQLFAIGWPEEGLLALMGYHVGQTSDLGSPVRRELLARIFSGQLPPVVSPGYMLEWSKPGTSLRLRKLAESIASFTRNAKRRRRSTGLADAISDWEDDLRFLYEGYYVGFFRFTWPSTKLANSI